MPDRRQGERRGTDRRHAGPRIRTTRDEVINAAKTFQWKGQLTDWTAIVVGQELPVRPFLIKVARAMENDSITGEEAAVILSDLGFEVRYKGATVPWEDMPA